MAVHFVNRRLFKETDLLGCIFWNCRNMFPIFFDVMPSIPSIAIFSENFFERLAFDSFDAKVKLPI
jgi:hypothetical protein